MSKHRIIRTGIVSVLVVLLAGLFPAGGGREQRPPTQATTIVATRGIVTQMLPRPPARRRAEPDVGSSAGSDDEDLPPQYVRAKRRANARLRAWMRHHRPRPHARAANAVPTSVGVLDGLNAAGQSDVAHPPDATGAIGPHDYVEYINSRIAVYRRSDLSLVSSLSMSSFDRNASSDPQVEWDPHANRWFYLTGVSSTLAWGFSKTSDPRDLANGWCHYALPLSPADVPNAMVDFPKLGYSDTELLFAADVFNGTSVTVGGATGFITAHIWAVNKPPAGPLATCPDPSTFTALGWGTQANPLVDDNGDRPYAPAPAQTADSSSTGYVISAYLGQTGGDGHHLYVWRHAPGSPDLVGASIAVPGYGVPPDVPQPGASGNFADSLSGQVTQAVAHADPDAGGAEAIWASHTIWDQSSPRAVLRWYELLPESTAAPVRQWGDIADPVNHVFNGAISPTGAGDEAIAAYDIGGPDLSAEIRARGRRAGTPPGEMGGEITLADSSADQNARDLRWGDYAAATPDPADAHAVWGTNEVAGPNGSDG